MLDSFIALLVCLNIHFSMHIVISWNHKCKYACSYESLECINLIFGVFSIQAFILYAIKHDYKQSCEHAYKNTCNPDLVTFLPV
jgi:hypothetical protein